MRVGTGTDVGRVRVTNEDAYWAQTPWFAVADGMGGHAAGEVASRLAVDSLARTLAAFDGGDVDGWLLRAVQQANRDVWARAQADAALAGMGTTLTVAHIEPGRMVIAHVGDSRCYRFRDGALQLLTADHSIVGELLRTGTLSEAEAEVHPHRNVLTRALGTAPHVEVDVLQEALRPGDRVLLCTDGLTSVLGDDEVALRLALSEPPESVTKRLVAAANEGGGPDNTTVVLVDIPRA